MSRRAVALLSCAQSSSSVWDALSQGYISLCTVSICPGRLRCCVCKADRRSHDQFTQTLWPLPGVPEYLHKVGVCVRVCVCVLKMNWARVVIIDVCVSLLLQLWCYDNNSAAFPPITPLSSHRHKHAVLSKYLRVNLFCWVLLWHIIHVFCGCQH